MTIKAPGIRSIVTASPIYYGWVVWMVAIVGMIASSPGQSFSVSLFMDFFIEDFDLDRTTVSSLYGAGTFIASLGLTWIGRHLDRVGNRRMGMAIGVLFGCVLCLCALISGPFMLLVVFVGIRGLGQGSLTLVSSTAVANWFRLRRGRMMAYLTLAYALFQGVYVNVLRLLLETVEWRQAFLLLGIGVVALVTPIFALLMRDKPEAYGLLPDDADRDHDLQEASAKSREDNWRLAEALRTPMFWVFIFSRALPSAWGTGMILHQVSIFAGLDHGARTVTETYALMTVFSAAAALLAGHIIDRFKPRYIAVLQMIALFSACLLSMVMRETWLLIFYALAFGLGLGIGYVFDGAVWTNLFGREFQGEIRGFVATAGIIGSAIGPALFGLSFDFAGGYDAVLGLGALLSVLVAALTLIAPYPKRAPA